MPAIKDEQDVERDTGQDTRQDTRQDTGRDKQREKIDPAKMTLMDLQEYAREHGIDTYAKTKKDILLELGISERPDVVVFERPVTTDKLHEIKDMKFMIPKNTVIPKENKEKWLKIIEKEPLAFNGVDLADKTTDIVHVLDPNIKCVCGAKFSMPRGIDMMMCPGVEETKIIKGERVKIAKCLPDGGFRKYLLHGVPEE